MITLVLDPGVIVSSAISSTGAPASLLRLWYDGFVDIVVCPRLIDELRRAFTYPKVRDRVPQREVDALIEMLWRGGTTLPDPGSVPRVCRDPDDDYLFALAHDAGAILIRGDRKVLEVEHTGVRVLRPAAIVGLLRGPGKPEA